MVEMRKKKIKKNKAKKKKKEKKKKHNSFTSTIISSTEVSVVQQRRQRQKICAQIFNFYLHHWFSLWRSLPSSPAPENRQGKARGSGAGWGVGGNK
jgi:adenine-specific DNA glycosylase